MKKGGQLGLLALLSAVLGISWKEAEPGKLSWRNLAHFEPFRISFLLDGPITSSLQKPVLERFTR